MKVINQGHSQEQKDDTSKYIRLPLIERKSYYCYYYYYEYYITIHVMSMLGANQDY